MKADAKLLLITAAVSPVFRKDENGNITDERIVGVSFNVATDMPRTPRMALNYELSEAVARELEKGITIPLELGLRFEKNILRLETFYKNHYHADFDEGDTGKFYDQMLECMHEGLVAYFANYPERWVKHICEVQDIKAGETVALGNGFAYNVKENMRIITEPMAFQRTDYTWKDNHIERPYPDQECIVASIKAKAGGLYLGRECAKYIGDNYWERKIYDSAKHCTKTEKYQGGVSLWMPMPNLPAYVSEIEDKLKV